MEYGCDGKALRCGAGDRHKQPEGKRSNTGMNTGTKTPPSCQTLNSPGSRVWAFTFTGAVHSIIDNRWPLGVG
jgi:hypothetical protein